MEPRLEQEMPWKTWLMSRPGFGRGFKVLVNCFIDDNDYLCRLTPTQATEETKISLEVFFVAYGKTAKPSLAVFPYGSSVVFSGPARRWVHSSPALCEDNKFMGELDEPKSSEELRELVLSESWLAFD